MLKLVSNMISIIIRRTVLTQFFKAYEKFYRKPIPNDITVDEVIYLAQHFGCEIKILKAIK